MSIDGKSQKPILTVTPEIYKLLDPLERLVLHHMAAEGRAKIIDAAGKPT